MFIGSNDDPAVALLAEGVDRNIGGLVNWPSEEVALLAEGVDRNRSWTEEHRQLLDVALLAEGVDRNSSVQVPSRVV